ncbi:hypothetical protein FZEAL_7667 [Fusarium zealandicum]|uniref:Nephrocystin 3-like N-terminal domain-containing protein n=1 Tax=Fusarium zealandicum TaxID=1053134 RepID=A0A8H4UG00_9HYPO|nr:hypothetical protein FZEAL_7667 [Fusarium zealandicum]
MVVETSSSNEELAKFFEKDAVCWEIAIQRHNNSLKHGKNKLNKYYVSLKDEKSILVSGADVSHTTVASAKDLINAAKTALSSSVAKRGKGETIFYQIVSFFQTHAHAINVFIQQEPRITALVWGSIRLLLQVVTDSEQASEVIAEGIFLITQHTGRWGTMARAFGHEQSVEEALINLLMPSTYSSVRETFAAKLHKLREAAEALDKEVFWEINRGQEEIKDMLLSSGSPDAGDYVLAMHTGRKGTDFTGHHVQQGTAGRAELESWPLHHLAKEGKVSLGGFHVSGITQAPAPAPIATVSIGRVQTNADAFKIRDWIGQLANPIAARPNGPVNAADIDDAEPWIVKHPSWHKWLEPDLSHPLWVSGPPGCGKSTLAHRAVEILSRTQHSTTIISHAFQSIVSTRHRRLTSLAASILHQLLGSYCMTEAQKNVFERLVSLYNQFKLNVEDCPFGSLWTHCLSLLKGEKGFILVIDALDECSFEHPKQVTWLLGQISTLLTSTTGSRAVIFSRPNPMLGAGLLPESQECAIHITKEDTLAELHFFCDSASARLPLPEPEQRKVAARARADAQGSFLWASLFLQRFKKTLDRKSFSEELNGFPDNCWDFYAKIWRDRVGELDSSQKGYCRDIILIVLGARRRLTIDELEDAIGLFSEAAPFIISSYCQPLIQVVEDGLQLSHSSVRDFFLNSDRNTQLAGMGFSLSEPDAVLAQRCLDYLLKDDYASVDLIGKRLRKNAGFGGSTENPEKSFYSYAAHNWHIHLTALSSPEPQLLELAGRFLRTLQFTHWAEYSYTDAGDFQAIRSTEITLHVWNNSLPEEDQTLLHLEGYFERPYSDLSRRYRDGSDDKILQWLCLRHLGYYYFDKGKITEMAKVRAEVAAGLSDLLGPRHPLSLEARSDAAYTYLFNGKLRKAQELYAGVVDDQRKVTGDDNPGQYFTLVYQAQAEYLLTDSTKALDTVANAVAGFFRTSGPQSNGFLVAQLWYAVVDATTGHTTQAIKMMEHVRDKRKEQYGPEDSFGIATQLFAGDLYRKLGKKEEALANIKPGLEFRRGFWAISHFLTIDTVLVLAIAYRDFGMNELAADLVEELEQHADLSREENFVRMCQVKHLRGLLSFDGGDIDQPIMLLQTLLVQTSPEDNNRALQWVRLDLAYMLRYREREGDEHLASSLFDGIVTDEGGEEPDPPQWLDIAERALRMMRAGNIDMAQDLLREAKLRWAREEDLWMWLGMPAADTGRMKPPRGLGDNDDGSSGWEGVFSE